MMFSDVDMWLRNKDKVYFKQRCTYKAHNQKKNEIKQIIKEKRKYQILIFGDVQFAKNISAKKMPNCSMCRQQFADSQFAERNNIFWQIFNFLYSKKMSNHNLPKCCFNKNTMHPFILGIEY